MDDRVPWEEYFLDITYMVAKRSTCIRRTIGAIAVIGKRIVATGYNGPPPGIEHCAELGGCMRKQLNIPSGEQQERCRAVHSEENIIIQAAIHGISLKGAVIYCTNQPCSMCARKLVSIGLNKLIYTGAYPDQAATDLFEAVAVPEKRTIGKYDTTIWTFK